MSDELRAAAERWKENKLHKNVRAGCMIISEGKDCQCVLCDCDRLITHLEAEAKQRQEDDQPITVEWLDKNNWECQTDKNEWRRILLVERYQIHLTYWVGDLCVSIKEPNRPSTILPLKYETVGQLCKLVEALGGK